MGLNKSCLFNAARYSILDMEYGVQISGIGGWGAELNREIVSCRACVRAVCMSSEIGVKIYGRLLSLFPFGLGRFSLFPSPAPQSPIQLQLALSVSFAIADSHLLLQSDGKDVSDTAPGDVFDHWACWEIDQVEL